uniref:SPRY domain-containing protein n=1 Tax=Meloidogyne incognita TaxID=6306 RepID=A0A914NVV0_MELIC
MSVSFEKKIGKLTNKLEQLTKSCKRACFVQIKNKWEGIINDCCVNKCSDEITNTKCIKGNGFVKLTDDENIKYINCVGRGINKYFEVYTENDFEEPYDCVDYSLFYFEIKVKIEGEKFSCISIDLRNDNKEAISLRPLYGVVENEKREIFKLDDDFSWKDEDIFGCGLVYPPTEKDKKLPYMFYTKNGEQIGKAILLKENFDSYAPFVHLRCCSVEANFGNNLEIKPFCYDITKHFVIKEFYEDSDVD